MFETTVIKNRKNKRIQKNKILQQFPDKNSDKYIETKSPMRLDQIALNEYGDPKFWRILATANNMDSIFVNAGIILRIPHSPQIKYVKE